MLLGLCLCCLSAVHLIFCKVVVSDVTGLISLASVMYFSMGMRCDVCQNYLIIPISLQKVCLESPCSTNISSFCLHGTLPVGHFSLISCFRKSQNSWASFRHLQSFAVWVHQCLPPTPVLSHSPQCWLPVKWLIFSGIRWLFLRLMLQLCDLTDGGASKIRIMDRINWFL